ncbi:MAG: glutamate--cysteine ligase [Planctomycetes bacterium]|nr:glutamate--cysteine ligase [Planctomycetota bacterium]
MSEWAFPGAEDRSLSGSEELVQAFTRSAKPPSLFRIGMEIEAFGVDASTGMSIPYSGERGIEAILARMAEGGDWELQTESGRPVGLARGESRVSLEPGGQFELATSPCRDLFELEREFETYRRELDAAARPLGVAFLGLGVHPFAPVDRIPWVPKARYDWMRRRLPSRGHLAHHMMKSTAAVQVSLDHADEEDMAAKLRVGLALSGVAAALFANASLSIGGPNGYQSLRGHVWRYTDPSRCGLIPAALGPGSFGYADYVDHALGVPVLFLLRDGRYLEIDASFREFLADGLGQHRATFSDWSMHLSGIFTEARLKNVVELRSVDSQPPDRVLAVPALWKGLLGHPESLREALAFVEGWGADELDRLAEAGARLGLGALFRGRPLAGWASDMVALARRGLDRADATGPGGRREPELLAPIEPWAGAGRSPGQEALDAWERNPAGIGAWVVDRYRF